MNLTFDEWMAAEHKSFINGELVTSPTSHGIRLLIDEYNTKMDTVNTMRDATEVAVKEIERQADNIYKLLEVYYGHVAGKPWDRLL